MRAAALLVFVVACGGSPSNAPPRAVAPTTKRTEPIKVGERMTPIAGPTAIPVAGAKLTMVNYFATWCSNSKAWLPHVEEMRKKYGPGLAIVGVANYDDAPQADLEAFVKEMGASFPVLADRDHRILNELPPAGWGQAIVVVDAQGIVRLVHRGTSEEAFAHVDAELGRLLSH